MKSSDKIDLLATALVKAQAAMEPVVKNASNPHFRSKYADLASVIEAVRGPLNANGIVFLQLVGGNLDGCEVETMLIHHSGQWISHTGFIPIPKKDAQAYCGGVTYLRRYGLMAITGLPAEDDDGNVASERPRHAPQAPAAAAPDHNLTISAEAARLGMGWDELRQVIHDATGIMCANEKAARERLNADARQAVIVRLLAIGQDRARSERV